MSDIGRRSVFAKEQQGFIAKSRNFNERIPLRGVIIDVCSSAKPKSKFLKGEYKKGITLFFVPYQECEVYAIRWKGSESDLRSNAGGTDENIIGSEVKITTRSRRRVDMHKAEISFDGQEIREVQNVSAPGYRSMCFYASMYTDYETQMLNNKKSSGGVGEIPLLIESE